VFGRRPKHKFLFANRTDAVTAPPSVLPPPVTAPPMASPVTPSPVVMPPREPLVAMPPHSSSAAPGTAPATRVMTLPLGSAFGPKDAALAPVNPQAPARPRAPPLPPRRRRPAVEATELPSSALEPDAASEGDPGRAPPCSVAPPRAQSGTTIPPTLRDRIHTSVIMPLEELVRGSIELWKPRWQPWAPRRVLGTALAFGAFMLLLILVTPRSLKTAVYRRAASLVSPHQAGDRGPTVTPDYSGDGRADERLVRSEKSPVAGAILSIPPAFSSADGSYDVVLHFHGNTDLVIDSYDVAKVNAVLVLVNIGIGSGPYEDRYSNPDVYRETLKRVDDVLGQRGLRHPRRRRIALSAWSAGYGAVVRIIENQSLADEIDAVVLLDGIHASYLQGGIVDPAKLAPYARFARKAIAGQKLFVITHSDIKPTEYAGTRETCDALLKLVDVPRTRGGEATLFPLLRSLHGVPRSKLVPLEPTSEAHAGDFHVRGYSGATPENHMAHLIQMATVALPYLAARWE
jgi:hypothetical protein